MFWFCQWWSVWSRLHAFELIGWEASGKSRTKQATSWKAWCILAVSVVIINKGQHRRVNVIGQTWSLFSTGQLFVCKKTDFISKSSISPQDLECVSDQNNAVTPSRWIQLSNIGPGPRISIQTKNGCESAGAVTTEKVMIASVKQSSKVEHVAPRNRGFLYITPVIGFKLFALSVVIVSYCNQYS